MSRCPRWRRIWRHGVDRSQMVSNLVGDRNAMINGTDVEWIRSELKQRKAHVEVLLESLEHRDAEIRFTNARRLFYVLQGSQNWHRFRHALYWNYSGTFAETSSPEHQLHWIFENCKVVRSANGLSTLVEALKIAGAKHDLLWYVKSFPYLTLRSQALNLIVLQQSHGYGHSSLTYLRFREIGLHWGGDHWDISLSGNAISFDWGVQRTWWLCWWTE